MSVSSAYIGAMQTANSVYNKNSIPKYPNQNNNIQDTSKIEVVKSGRKVLADDLINDKKQKQTTANTKINNNANNYNQSQLSSQSIKNALFGKNNSNLLSQIEQNLNVDNFSKKVKNINLYVDDMVANIKEVMDEKGLLKAESSVPSYKRFNVTI